MRIALPLITGTAAAAVGFLTLPAVAPAACVPGENENRERSSVDSGEIRWTERTSYDNARRWATARWQYRGSRIRILADTAGTVNDMEWRDYDRADGHGGYHHFRGGVAETDYVYLNKRYLKAGSALGTPDKRRAVAAHELGHAVGLCHKRTDVFSVIWKAQTDPPVLEPTDVDKANYRRLWGN